jgi:hypothetical protein
MLSFILIDETLFIYAGWVKSLENFTSYHGIKFSALTLRPTYTPAAAAAAKEKADNSHKHTHTNPHSASIDFDNSFTWTWGFDD